MKKQYQFIIRLFLLSYAMLLSGCATYLVRANPEVTMFWDTGPHRLDLTSEYPLYPAARVDIETLKAGPIMIIPVVIDLPISLGTDTLLFPMDFIKSKRRGD